MERGGEREVLLLAASKRGESVSPKCCHWSPPMTIEATQIRLDSGEGKKLGWLGREVGMEAEGRSEYVKTQSCRILKEPIKGEREGGKKGGEKRGKLFTNISTFQIF